MDMILCLRFRQEKKIVLQFQAGKFNLISCNPAIGRYQAQWFSAIWQSPEASKTSYKKLPRLQIYPTLALPTLEEDYPAVPSLSFLPCYLLFSISSIFSSISRTLYFAFSISLKSPFKKLQRNRKKKPTAIRRYVIT